MAFLTLKSIHILAVVIALGAHATYAIWLGRAKRDPQNLEFALQSVRHINLRVANPAYILQAITGVWMVVLIPFPWSAWLETSTGLYVLMAALGMVGFGPALRKQLARLKADGLQSAGFQSAARSTGWYSLAILLLGVLIVLLMVYKPTLWG